jgi:phage baseplate assembly protein W
MIGMNRNTGAALSGNAHLAQSIGVILSTPLGSRIARREFGSQLPDLIDAPANPATLVLLYAAAAAALIRWEPRIDVQRVSLSAADALAGRWILTVTGRIVDTDAVASLSVDVRTGVPA